MGRSDRYTETFTSIPEGHRGAYVIPPLEDLGVRGSRRRRPQARQIAVVQPIAALDAGSRRSSGGRAARVLITLVIIAGVVTAAATTQLFGLWPALVDTVSSVVGDAEEGPDPVVVNSPQPSASPEPTMPPTPDPSEFVEADSKMVADLMSDPAAHVGEALIVYAEVLVVDTVESNLPAGRIAHLVTLSAQQPADDYEFSGTADSIITAPDSFDTTTNAVLRVWLTVPDPATVDSFYSTSVGYPRFDVVRVEEVGPYDLTQDVTLGELRTDGDRPVLPVKVHNSAGVPMEYSISITAQGADGAEAASTSAWSEEIAPGKSGPADVELYGTVPDGVTFRIDDVSRYAQ